jgi:hypothetical protein
MVLLRPIQEHDQIGILLDRSGLPEVRQLRAMVAATTMRQTMSASLGVAGIRARSARPTAKMARPMPPRAPAG